VDYGLTPVDVCSIDDGEELADARFGGADLLVGARTEPELAGGD
jgi:hypothetical protein